MGLIGSLVGLFLRGARRPDPASFGSPEGTSNADATAVTKT